MFTCSSDVAVGTLGAVELWFVRPQASGAAALPVPLAPEERRRLATLHRPEHRTRFRVVRGALRRALARRVGCEPSEVPIVLGRYGKPQLPGPAGPWFSVSHSGELAIIAVCGDGPVGVDVEQQRSGRRLDLLAEASFTPAERRWYEGAPGWRPFYDVWTAKEACVKLTGTGLTVPPTDVSLHDPGASPTAARVPPGPGEEAVAATVVRLGVGRGYSAALAVGDGALLAEAG